MFINPVLFRGKLMMVSYENLSADWASSAVVNSPWKNQTKAKLYITAPILEYVCYPLGTISFKSLYTSNRQDGTEIYIIPPNKAFLTPGQTISSHPQVRTFSWIYNFLVQTKPKLEQMITAHLFKDIFDNSYFFSRIKLLYVHIKTSFFIFSSFSFSFGCCSKQNGS